MDWAFLSKKVVSQATKYLFRNKHQKSKVMSEQRIEENELANE